ncbi:MAG: zinc-ribbon domain-containing protein [Gemmataceae bacterium]|nr:zinc-ribbon domain-containing protein [Gemmataceae bacterium]
MSLEFSCPQCSGTLEVDESMIGTVIRCGDCGTLMRVPSTPYGIAERVRDESSGTSPPPVASGDAPPAELSPIPSAGGAPPPRPRPEVGTPWPPPPPASPGRSVAFWVLIVISGLILGSCLCCCGILAVLPEPDWQIYTNPEGWFRVELPAPPRSQLRPPAFLPRVNNPRVEGCNLDKYGEDYRVISWDVQPRQRPGQTDEALMQGALEDLQGQLRGERIVEGPRLVPNQPRLTYELHWYDKGNRLHIARLVLAGERFYLLLVQSRYFWAEPDPERVERFFQSFRVLRLRAQDPLPPELLGPPRPKQKDNRGKK